MPVEDNYRDLQYKQVPKILSRPAFLPSCSMGEEPALCPKTVDMPLQEKVSHF